MEVRLSVLNAVIEAGIPTSRSTDVFLGFLSRPFCQRCELWDVILEETPYRSRGILFLPDWAGPAVFFCKGPQRGSVRVFQGLQAVCFLLSCSAPPLKLRAAPGPTDERPWPVELSQSVWPATVYRPLR